MVFSSTLFLFVFLPVTLAGYYLIRKELRNAFLLIASLLFYAAGEPSFVMIMAISILLNYLLGLLIWRLSHWNKAVSGTLLMLSLCLNLGILFYYKYFDFVVLNLNGIFGTSIALRNIVLPIGISFFTFQGMSYVLDVYMGKTDVQMNPVNVALYIALFPQLIAGPIVRYSDVNREIEGRCENLDDFASGVQRFVFGLAKKVILSNAFAIIADEAFTMNSAERDIAMAWLGAVAYAIQIYFDFSGYSDMAIGLGRMFGFHFHENFDYPYTSSSVTVFWRKWHISLSSWFRDYVYIPLGGNRRGNVYLNLLIVFILTGLWHGASWNYVIWGLWHGCFLIVERVLRNKHIEIPLPRAFKWAYTMLVVLIGWVFFRAPGFLAGLEYLKSMAGINSTELISAKTCFYFREFFFSFLIAALCCTPVFRKMKCKFSRNEALRLIGCAVQCTATILIFLLTIGTMSVTTYNPFIYFNF